MKKALYLIFLIHFSLNIFAQENNYFWINQADLTGEGQQKVNHYSLGLGQQVEIIKSFGKYHLVKMISSVYLAPVLSNYPRALKGQIIWVEKKFINSGSPAVYNQYLNLYKLNWRERFSGQTDRKPFSLISFSHNKPDLSFYEGREKPIALIFEMIKLTPTGNKLVEFLLSHLNDNTIRVLDLLHPQCLSLSTGEPLHGLYFNGVICLDLYAPFSLLLPTLIHEGYHALDLYQSPNQSVLLEFKWANKTKERLVFKALNENLTQNESRLLKKSFDDLTQLGPQRDQIILGTEYKSYHAVDQFIQEFTRFCPNYHKIINQLVRHGQWTGYPITDSLFEKIMIEKMGIAPRELERFKMLKIKH